MTNEDNTARWNQCEQSLNDVNLGEGRCCTPQTLWPSLASGPMCLLGRCRRGRTVSAIALDDSQNDRREEGERKDRHSRGHDNRKAPGPTQTSPSPDS